AGLGNRAQRPWLFATTRGGRAANLTPPRHIGQAIRARQTHAKFSRRLTQRSRKRGRKQQRDQQLLPNGFANTASSPGGICSVWLTARTEATSMDITKRRELASRLLDGYVHGPAAATEATARALVQAAAARAIVLVEGISDQIALETLAIRRGRDLGAEGVAVLPAGGAHAIARYLTRFGPAGAGLRLSGLCDLGEETVVRRGLASAGIGSPRTRAEMERLGFYVCVEDLEDELIRAIGAARVEALIDSPGDLGSFRSLQGRPQRRRKPPQPRLPPL